MSRRCGGPRSIALLALAFAAAAAACDNPFALPPAALPPTEFTLTLYAITGTPLVYPSALNLMTDPPAPVRTDRTSNLDFAFDVVVDSLGDTTAVLLPRGALGLYRDGGLQLTRTPYDSITFAPNSGYDVGTPVTVGVGSVVLASSRSQTCNIGYVYPLYAKMAVTALDLTARSITFKMLIDSNCGYRSLQSSTVPPSK
jgi:hypothetical protein